MTNYFSIASAVLFLTSAGLATGWTIDHSQQKRATDNVAIGYAVFERNEATLACIYSCNHCADQLRQKFQHRRLCKCIVDSWMHRDQIVAAKRKVDISSTHAGEALWLLGFKTPDEKTAREFTEFVSEVMPNDGSNFSPEIHDKASSEHEAFTGFITSALIQRNQQAEAIVWEK